jgi:hypothetical protein
MPAAGIEERAVIERVIAPAKRNRVAPKQRVAPAALRADVVTGVPIEEVTEP